MILRHTTLTAVGLALALGALYWVDPLTFAGQMVLAALVVALVNVLGGALWRG